MLRIILLLTLGASCFAENCDKLGVLIYEDMGCNATYDPGNKCPSSYSCEGLQPSTTHCHYNNGRVYKVGDRVGAKANCHALCDCAGTKNGTRFACDVEECKSAPPAPGCYLKTRRYECCGTEYCPEKPQSPKCTIDGKGYFEGERFYPKDVCMTCTCESTFRGKYEIPHCLRTECSIRLRYSEQLQQGCAPVYANSQNAKCCPSSWLCPDGTENISGESQSDKTCKFGSKDVKVGQRVEKVITQSDTGTGTRKYTCECTLPPLLSCTVE